MHALRVMGYEHSTSFARDWLYALLVSKDVCTTSSGRLYLADYGSTDHGLADHVIRKMSSILSTWEKIKL